MLMDQMLSCLSPSASLVCSDTVERAGEALAVLHLTGSFEAAHTAPFGSGTRLWAGSPERCLLSLYGGLILLRYQVTSGRRSSVSLQRRQKNLVLARWLQLIYFLYAKNVVGIITR